MKNTVAKDKKTNSRMISIPAIAVILIFIAAFGGLTGMVIAQDKDDEEKIQKNAVNIAVMDTTLEANTITLQRVEKKINLLVEIALKKKAEPEEND